MIPECKWFKSSRSIKENQCVEVAMPGNSVAVRDSTRPEQGHIAVNSRAWANFLNSLKRG